MRFPGGSKGVWEEVSSRKYVQASLPLKRANFGNKSRLLLIASAADPMWALRLQHVTSCCHQTRVINVIAHNLPKAHVPFQVI